MNGTPALQILECQLSLVLPLLTQPPLSQIKTQRHLREEIRTDKLDYPRQRLSPMKLIVLG
jgi:hypothetical protein